MLGTVLDFLNSGQGFGQRRGGIWKQQRMEREKEKYVERRRRGVGRWVGGAAGSSARLISPLRACVRGEEQATFAREGRFLLSFLPSSATMHARRARLAARCSPAPTSSVPHFLGPNECPRWPLRPRPSVSLLPASQIQCDWIADGNMDLVLSFHDTRIRVSLPL